MSGKIGPHQPKVNHGHPLPDHLNPAKHPDGMKIKDHETGSSGKSPDKDSANAEVHKPGQDAPASLSAETYTPSSGRPECSSSGTPSNNSSPIRREAGSESNRANTSNVFDEVLSLMGGGRFKNWNDYHKAQTFSKADRFDMELDKNSFIATHLNPDIHSPEHVKTNWTRLPGIDHPMHADYTIAQNPEYYTFRRPIQHSGPLTLPSQFGAKADYQTDPRSTQSSPSGSFRMDMSADIGGSVDPQSTTAPKGKVQGNLTAGKKMAIAGTASVMAVGLITVAAIGSGSDSSNASEEASA